MNSLSIKEKNILLNKVATFLEENPSLYNFMEDRIPKEVEEGCPACMLAWAGHFLYLWELQDDLEHIANLLGFPSELEFYEACEKVLDEMGEEDSFSYQDSALTSARALREIARQKFPINLPAREREEIPLED